MENAHFASVDTSASPEVAVYYLDMASSIAEARRLKQRSLPRPLDTHEEGQDHV